MLRFDFSFDVPGKGAYHAQGDFHPGLRLALLGPSGCGKSTFLKSLCGLTPKLSGNVWWKDTPLNQALLNAGTVGFSFQNSPLFGHLTVRENLLLPFKTLSSFGNFSESLRLEKVNTFLNKAKLTSLADRLPAHLSGGEKKRVSLLRAMIFDAPLLVLDEPFSDLDAENRAIFKEWLASLIQDFSGILLYVTHSEEDLSLANSKMSWPTTNAKLDFGKRP